MATPTQAMVIDDGDALFDRHPEVERYDHEYVIRMIVDARDGQMGIGCVVNAIVWFNLLWLNQESILAQLRAMEPSSKVLEAIRWMELDLPKSQMPMIASRLEEIIDSIKMNGKSVEWASAAITEFRNTCPGSSEVLVARWLSRRRPYSLASPRQLQRTHSGDHGNGCGS